MSSSKVNFLPKSTVELEITIPWDEVKTSYDKIFAQVSQEIEISGFRKGKAPKDIVEKNINKSKLFEEVIKEVVPNAYTAALRQHNLTPVSNPKIQLVSAKEGEDWVVKVTIAIKPKINLGNYKEKIRELKKNKIGIWTPGKDKKKEEENKPILDEIVNIIITEVEVEPSDILVDEEVNRLLANLIDQTQKLGLTIEQYLASKGKTSDQLRGDYKDQALKNLTLEFALSAIADSENITVSQEDIDKIISNAKTDEEKENLKKQSYYLAHLIRQQKTLDFLNSL